MAPPKVKQYVWDVFGNTDIKLEVVSDRTVLEQEYPLFAAVDRAANGNYEKIHLQLVALRNISVI